MNVVFLGLLYTERSMQTARKYSKRGLQMAPHVFQTTLIRGLMQAGNTKLSVLNVPPVGSFPVNYRSPLVHRENWGDYNKQIGYLNLPLIKKAQQKRALIRAIKSIIAKDGTDDLCLIAYSTYEPFLEVLDYFKKKHPRIKSCLIVTDCIPGRGDMEKYMTPKAKKAGDRVVKLAKSIDSFALLTKHLAEALEIGSKPYVITECICNELQDSCISTDGQKHRCLYTGTLGIEFGICELAEAFASMDNCELWICGNGSGRARIEELAEKHENIQYYGFLPPERLQELRNSCDFLINPRRPTGTYTKYSFPSKTAEYLMSAKPVIMYKLEGIPDEYDAYLNYLSASDSDGIKEELNRIFSMEYTLLTAKADEGRSFMVKNKTAQMQGQRILSLLTSCQDMPQ